MSGIYIGVLAFLIIALIALVAMWFVARRMQNELSTSPSAVAGARASIDLSPASAARLRELSSEPILLKQTPEGVRVQIEHRPMLPLMAYVGQDVSSALNEAAVRVSEQWGPAWVVLLTAGTGDQVSAQRLA